MCLLLAKGQLRPCSVVVVGVFFLLLISRTEKESRSERKGFKYSEVLFFFKAFL